MTYNVETISNFRKEAKKLIKKYPSVKQELAALENLLSKSPDSGIPLGQNCFKIRMTIASKGKGKSGGARIITHLYVEEETVYLLSIFDKSYQESISDKKIKALLKGIR